MATYHKEAVVHCIDCIFWEKYRGDERELGLCKRMSEGMPAEGPVMAYAEADINHIGASVNTSPEFGCVLGIGKASESGRTTVTNPNHIKQVRRG